MMTDDAQMLFSMVEPQSSQPDERQEQQDVDIEVETEE